MAICPFAVQQLIPETWQQGSIRPTTVILHRAVSSAKSLQDYWNSPGVVVESHFYVGETGTIYQFVDTEVRADANVSANGFAVSIETWDGGNTPDSMEWNPAQVAAIKRLVAWICDTHHIAKRAATAWNSGGIGGHNWFADEWAGGPRGCPGTARNNQIRNDIIPAVQRGQLEGDDMSFSDRLTNAEGYSAPAGELLAAAEMKIDRLTRPIPVAGEDRTTDVVTEIGWLPANFRTINAQLAALVELVAAKAGISPTEFAAAVDAAVKKHTPSAADIAKAQEATLAPLVEAALKRVQDTDNIDEARQTATELLRLISNAA